MARKCILACVLAVVIAIAPVVAIASTTVAGHVTVAGTPYFGAIVGIKQVALGGYALADATYYATTDGSGNYSVDVPAGSYLVAAWPQVQTAEPFVERYAMSDNRSVSVSTGQTATADFDIKDYLGPNVAKLSSGGTATASHNPGAAANAFNGTRLGSDSWYAVSSAGQTMWLKRDLGANPPPVDDIVYATDNRRVRTFSIAYSNNDSTYTTVFSANNSAGGYHYISTDGSDYYWEMIKLQSRVTARYWKLTITQSPAEEALHELELYSTVRNTIPDIKKLPNGNSVTLSGKMVTAVPGGPIPFGVLYVEEPDRFAGIRVAFSELPPLIGDSVTLIGVMATTTGGERYIDATAGSVIVDYGTVLGPLGANTKDLAAGMMDGLLVRIAGTVRTVGADYYLIADGYRKTGAEVRTKVMVGGSPGVSPGDFVTVTGIAGKDGSRVVLKLP